MINKLLTNCYWLTACYSLLVWWLVRLDITVDITVNVVWTDLWRHLLLGCTGFQFSNPFRSRGFGWICVICHELWFATLLFSTFWNF